MKKPKHYKVLLAQSLVLKLSKSFVGSIIGVETIQTFGRKILALPFVTIGLLFVMGAEGE